MTKDEEIQRPTTTDNANHQAKRRQNATKQRTDMEAPRQTRTSQETPAGRIDSEMTVSNPKQNDKENPKGQSRFSKATTLGKSKGVAAPSFHPGTLVEKGLNLLQLSLKHALDVLALIVQLCSDLGLQGRELAIRSFGRLLNGCFHLLLVRCQTLNLLLKCRKTSLRGMGGDFHGLRLDLFPDLGRDPGFNFFE
jgi:hypothetical protein